MTSFTASRINGLRDWLGSRVRPPVFFGPVFFRELVRSGRRGRHTFLRLLYTGLILTFLYLTYSEWSTRALHPRRLAGFAFACFTTFTLVQFTAVFLMTPAYLATVITEEKEGKTLEYLLATDLGSREIVLGKTLARLANIGLLILAGLPILSLLELSGGVAPEWVLIVFTATLITMVSLAAVSTLCSVYARKSLNALICSYLIVVMYLGVSAALQWLLAFPALAGTAVTWGEEPFTIADVVKMLNAGNLPVALLQLNQSFRTRSTGTVLLELLRNYALFHGVVTAVCLGAGVARLRAVSRRQAEGTVPRRRRRLVRPAVWRFPVLWRELFVETDLRLGWAGKTGIFLFFLVCLAPALIELAALFERGLAHFLLSVELQGLGSATTDGRSFQWADARERMNLWVSIVGTAAVCATIFMMLIRAAGSISGEAARHTLDALLTTPLSSRAIVAGKALGCLAPLRVGWWWLLVVFLLGYGTRSLNPRLLPALLGAATVYAAFFVLVGLLLSTVCRTTTQATLASLGVAIGTVLAPGIPISLVQLWYFSDDRGFKAIAPSFDLLYLFSPPELLRFLLLRGPNSLWTRFPGSLLVLVSCGHIALYVVASIFLWRSVCSRVRVEPKPAEPSAEEEVVLRPLAAEERLA